MLFVDSKDIWAMHMDGTVFRYEASLSYIERHANLIRTGSLKDSVLVSRKKDLPRMSSECPTY